MRMFWACTHVMLKITEIPMFVNAGLEVIPTEVTPNVMHEGEALKYDAPESAVNQMWRSNLTVADDVVRALARSRLWERNGLVDQQEQDLFNQYIDVIYIPTRLDLAVQIGRWFKGIVIFRYFGDLNEGKKYLGNIPLGDLEVIKKMVFLPIFKSLLDDHIAKHFNNTFVLHNYLDDSIVPGKWSGFVKDSPAVVVLGSVHQFEPFQKILRDLIPLTRKFPIKLLGKNIESQLPKDIASAFQVKTDLARPEFFAEFFSSQFLIYPHARKNHSHNVPIEAIYGGMPLALRTQTPTFVENSHPLLTKAFPSRVGASRSEHSLRVFASDLYNDEEKLRMLARSQQRLTAPYQLENVASELRVLLAYLQTHKPTRAEPELRTPVHTLMASYPPSDYFVKSRRVIEQDFNEPLHHLISGPELNEVTTLDVDGKQRIVIRVPKSPRQLQIILGIIPGSERFAFSAQRQHVLKIGGFRKGFGECTVTAEIYVKDECLTAMEYQARPDFFVRERLVPQENELEPFTAEFNFAWHEPFQLNLIFKSAAGSGDAYIENITHGFASMPHAE
jgi:hypothetical protein